MDLATIATIVGIASTVLLIIGKVTGALGWLVGKLMAWAYPKPSMLIEVPKRTMMVFPETSPNACWWHMGAQVNDPIMQIVGDVRVTSIYKRNILIAAARLKKPRAMGGAHIFNGDDVLPAEAVARVRFDIWVKPPVYEKGASFKTDVAIIDQFGNEHWLKGVEFRYL